MKLESKDFKAFSLFGVPTYISLWLVFWYILYVCFLATDVSHPFFFFVGYISILLHEYGHVFAAQKCGMKVSRVTLYPFGGLALLEEKDKTPEESLLISISGPIVNLVIFFIAAVLSFLFPVDKLEVSYECTIPVICVINFAIAAFNLIPVYPMDGGRILMSMIWGFSGDKRKAILISTKISLFLSIAFGILFFYMGFIMGFIIMGFISISSYKSISSGVFYE